MKKVFGAFGVAAGCGVCCALPLLGSLTASSLGIAFGWQAAALASLLALVAMVLLIRHRVQLRVAPLNQASSGGIKRASGLRWPSNQVKREIRRPVACSLPGPEMLERADAIASVARRGLLAHQQCGSSLYLRYSSKVGPELENLVVLEQESCPFLDFELTHRADAVQLVITAPAAAAEFAPTLTSHFLGKPTEQFACSSSCGCNSKATVTT